MGRGTHFLEAVLDGSVDKQNSKNSHDAFVAMEVLIAYLDSPGFRWMLFFFSLSPFLSVYLLKEAMYVIGGYNKFGERCGLTSQAHLLQVRGLTMYVT